jgi:site-specific DNA-methyltransferase (adenine-specific)
MDSVFEPENFRNEIIWCYRRYTAVSNRFQRLHDVILFYSKSKTAKFNDIRVPYTEKSGKQDSHYKQDEQGKWYRWQKRKGQEPYKIYLSEGVRLGDWWDIPHINASSKERLGYPTQKPLALLERIVKASSSEDDLIMDPFCGCGTAVDAAQKLGRRWIGIDITHLAVGLIERRLKQRYQDIVFDIQGIPKDLEGLKAMAAQARSNPRLYYELQYWAINRIQAAQHAQSQKKGADKGIDGIVWLRPSKGSYEKALISVKAGENIGIEMVRSLIATVGREKAKLGILITLTEPTRPMKGEAATAGIAELEGVRCPKIQILTFQDLLDGRQPQLPYADYSFAPSQAQRDEGEQGQLL